MNDAGFVTAPIPVLPVRQPLTFDRWQNTNVPVLALLQTRRWLPREIKPEVAMALRQALQIMHATRDVIQSLLDPAFPQALVPASAQRIERVFAAVHGKKPRVVAAMNLIDAVAGAASMSADDIEAHALSPAQLAMEHYGWSFPQYARRCSLSLVEEAIAAWRGRRKTVKQKRRWVAIEALLASAGLTSPTGASLQREYRLWVHPAGPRGKPSPGPDSGNPPRL